MQVTSVHGAPIRDGQWWWQRTAELLLQRIGIPSRAVALPWPCNRVALRERGGGGQPVGRAIERAPGQATGRAIEKAVLPVGAGREADFEAAFATATSIIARMPGFRWLTMTRGVEPASPESLFRLRPGRCA